MGLGKRRALILVVAFAVVGAIVGIVIWQTTGKDDKANNQSGGGSNSNNSNGGGGSSTSGGNGGNSSSNTSLDSKITSDPATAKYTLSAYAIGDWGTTVERASCCKRRAGYTVTNTDKNAEDVVATTMGKAVAAADVKPKVILGHGDNFYWVGIIDKTDQAYRFDKTFESKFNAASLAGIPWVNVLGNHDYGGASYICASGGQYVPCKNAQEIVQGLKDKFSLQAEYKSPNSDRWILKDHFYVHTIEDKDSGVSIDIFNVDTNDADTHGGSQICCQCYGYSNGDDDGCDNVSRGDKFCAGGDTGMYDACMKQLKDWADDSRAQLKEKVKASKATWKIVNSHYSPYNHYSPDGMKVWMDLLKDSGIQLWINGHTHAEKHDFGKMNMHFIENGAGGGILNEASSGVPPYAEDQVEKIWAYGEHDYGFFDLTASKEWLRVRFLTNDDKWNVEDDFTKSTIGGVASKHCWFIPVDGTKGKTCDNTAAANTNTKSIHVRVEKNGKSN